ncbi:DUF2085 domain-containing protein [Oscillatoria sp. CS-180]|uniref:DUF2085 domain-containing protein n=1 Tax=Oscillatoria sp. CS-180 TaxID=3021720 RepID=UPI0023314A77|nr:DUF2085 domain-containing protein [Oscillatoria sp. CS-180]MDB9527559.1 DUF2085 domain-containing protein [Oscillatoria sp. CS-180]
MQGSVSASSKSRPWSSWLADIVLAGLVSGPFAAPFLAASGLPVLTQISEIIYWMGQQVCPQPDMGVPLAAGNIMAVCMRCYGTVFGLVAMRVLYGRDRGQSAYWLDRYGLIGFGLAFALCMMYPAELALQGFPWWPMSNLRMALFGAVAGIGLGAYIMPIFHSYLEEG